MTRVYAKTQRPATSSPSTTPAPNSDMSLDQPQSTATPAPTSARDSSSLNSRSESDRSEQAMSAQKIAQDKHPKPPAPGPSQPPKDFDKPDTRPTPVPPHDSLKVPSLAHKARLRVHFEDLTHPAVAKFLAVMPISTLLQIAISNVEKHLFTPSGKHHNPSKPPSHPPQTTPNPTTTIFPTSTSTTNNNISLASRPPPQNPITPLPPPTWQPQEVRAVTLIIRSMNGVAYTTGTDLDPSHKEMHLNIGYIEHIMTSTADKDDADTLFKYELLGVITHEMVHAFQHNAHSSCPGGLIEGIADYVRLKSSLGAKHWTAWPANKKNRGEKWDEGYQKTAWFLLWVEEEVGRDVIGRLNFEMRGRKWDGGKVWRDVMGEGVESMWGRYVDAWEEMNRKHEKENGEKGEEVGEVQEKKGEDDGKGVCP